MEILPAEHERMAYAIGALVLSHLKEDEVWREILLAAESKAMKALHDIQEALDDDTLDDPGCFYRIEAIRNALESNGITSLRHDW